MKNTNLTKTFFQLVQIDSPSGHEEKLANFCIKYLQKMNFRVVKDDFGNIIAKNKPKSKITPFLLCGHLDTVEPGTNIKPTLDKNIVKSDGKTILGGDNKLAIAIYFETIKSLLLEKNDLPPIEIVLTKSEELGMIGSKNLNFSLIQSKQGISLDAEGPIYTYISSSPFAEIIEIKITGKSAHASQPEEGIDALKIFSEAYSNIKTGRIDVNNTINIGLINGGNGNNIVMDNIMAKGNIRSQDPDELKIQKQTIKQSFTNSAKKYKGKVTFKFTKVIDGYKYNQNSPIVQKITTAINHQLKQKITNSGSDTNIFNSNGIEIVELCNGLKYTHTTREQFSIKDAKKLLNIVKSIILQLKKLHLN